MARNDKKTARDRTTPVEKADRTPAVAPSVSADRLFLKFGLGLGIVFGLWSLFSAAGWGAEVTRLAMSGWGAAAESIARTKNMALAHASVMTFLAVGVLWLLLRFRGSKKLTTAFGVALVAVVTADAAYLSRHYVKGMSASVLDDNDVIKMVKETMPDHRAVLLAQDGFYNAWLTYLFPYHNILSMNIPQMPRMPADYKNFLDMGGRNPLRLWQMSSVELLLGPVQAWSQIQNMPDLKDSVELVYAYTMVPSENMSMKIVPGTQQQPGNQVVLRLKNSIPRFMLVTGWEVADDGVALAKLVSDKNPVGNRLLVAPEFAGELPGISGEGRVGSVQRLQYRSGYVKLKVSTEQAAILRFAERYDPDWKATVDGKPAKVLRVDYLCQGVVVQPGLHEVVLRYAPANWSFVFQIAGLGLCAGSGLSLILKRRRSGASHE